MTRRDWWLGLLLAAMVVLWATAFPRYEWRQDRAELIRIDRWTGRAEAGGFYDDRGWVSIKQRTQEQRAYQAREPQPGAPRGDR